MPPSQDGSTINKDSAAHASIGAGFSVQELRVNGSTAELTGVGGMKNDDGDVSMTECTGVGNQGWNRGSVYTARASEAVRKLESVY